jgi:hypothetical protein
MAVYHRTQRLQIYGEKPEVTKLFGDRYRMVVRCKAARDTEAWYNANKDQIFASFGTLYSAQMSVDGIDPRVGEAYPDMCLVSNGASYTQTGEYVITFVYETLTAVWTKEQDDEVASTDNGLRVLERSEVAKVDGFPIVQLSSPNSSKVVLSGMGNASNYFVLLVKANSANTIYWRATNEALATQTGSFTTANTVQWEYKVIYTPISIDQLEIGYDGTNYSTFDLSEFYLVSQSSDWQNNIVESFIKFEVTVDNPSPFTDTVVFTGSNGNTATGTNVQGGGTGSISSAYDEDAVGLATITDGGKTLYLASFQDQTGADNDAQVGRVVTRWAEAGTLNVQRRSESEGVYRVTTTFLGAQGTVVGPIVAKSEDDYDGLKTITVVHMQKADGTSLIDDQAAIVTHNSLSEFSYPGVVTISNDLLDASLSTYSFQAKDFKLEPPSVALIPSVTKVFFKTTNSITYSEDHSLWSPRTWAQGESRGIAWNYLPFSNTQAFRGYRIDTSEDNTNLYTGLGAVGNALTAWDMISGKRIYARTRYRIEVSGGPPDPVGNDYTLSYNIAHAFSDIDGTPYYKHTEVTATIPAKT